MQHKQHRCLWLNSAAKCYSRQRWSGSSVKHTFVVSAWFRPFPSRSIAVIMKSDVEGEWAIWKASYLYKEWKWVFLQMCKTLMQISSHDLLNHCGKGRGFWVMKFYLMKFPQWNSESTKTFMHIANGKLLYCQTVALSSRESQTLYFYTFFRFKKV